ncbi:hypothetical protein LTR78_007434 [Recurvomyces mirabilis]|uniref:PNPLA domain-containing protein n=1 Tax=Recurvomyces mirabilis TaxID=574656 RepID=A0AAE0WJ85_9PEZI|nr:hypothetical protein LTR78_007434 [Recurvomyces mirabilis]KAK5160057.1 hypothetical protein LTS14_002163 [Recurvomyces mirabilis]
MGWDTSLCIQRFENIATKTFDRHASSGFSFARLQNLALSYLRDGQYSSSPIEAAFRSELGKDIRMFNPLSSDLKVAVTTTTAKESKTCLFSNYNGNLRSCDSGYDVVRTRESVHDVSVAQAASCTSAAPWFFRPKAIENVGTFQDGGLQHNNPLNLALWELRHLWPDRSTPDFALSIGTGYSESLLSRACVGTQSPVRDRFIARLFKTFMKSLDGEKMWKEFHNSLPDYAKQRYHRINIAVEGSEPAIDDIASMHNLKRQALAFLERDNNLQAALDAMISSLFYFELEDVPEQCETGYVCDGHIYCRLALPPNGRRWLFTQLTKTSSFFIILGQPIACVDRTSKNLPSFRRRVRFTIGSLDENIGITLRGITDSPTAISGMPKTAKQLVEMQGLTADFGCLDHRGIDKALPRLPQKRKHYGIA